MNNLDDRHVILFSHHQPISNTGGAQGKKLRARLAPILATRKVRAWYWGHEHVCALYDEHPSWSMHGRCIGHGGIPEFRDKHPELRSTPERRLDDAALVRVNGVDGNPSCLLLDGPNRDIIGHEDEYLPHGYLTLRGRPQADRGTTRSTWRGALDQRAAMTKRFRIEDRDRLELVDLIDHVDGLIKPIDLGQVSLRSPSGSSSARPPKRSR